MGHQNADIDSVGSSIGLYRFAKMLKEDVHIVNNTKSMAINGFIDTIKEQEEYKDVIIDKSQAISKTNSETLLIK